MREAKLLVARARGFTVRSYYGLWSRHRYLSLARSHYDAAVRIYMAQERRYQGGLL